MDISRIGKADYFFTARKGKTERNRESTGCLKIAETGQDYFLQEKTQIMTKSSLMDSYCKMKQMKTDIKEDEKQEDGKKGQKTKAGETKTDADIIVKPDGSRVLVVTTHIGSMETTMSLEISKPTDMDNEIRNDEKMEDSVEKWGKNVTIGTET